VRQKEKLSQGKLLTGKVELIPRARVPLEDCRLKLLPAQVTIDGKTPDDKILKTWRGYIDKAGGGWHS